MKIIGIDPGLASTGIGIVEGAGTDIREYAFGGIDTKSGIPLPARLDRIYSVLRSILDKESPELMVVEDIFSLNVYPKSGITLGKVTGVVLLAGHRANVPVTRISVREAKRILTGNGNADKSQLELCVRHVLKEKARIKPYHASDALALALIGLYRSGGAMNGLDR